MKETTLCYIEQDGNYLMLCRDSGKQDGSAGKWLGVGGKMEPGETPQQCLLREVFEETGLNLTSYEQRGVIQYRSDTWEDEVMYLYTADGFEGELNDFCEEGELKWVPADEVMDLRLWEGDRIFLRRLADGETDIRMTLVYEGDKLVRCEQPNMKTVLIVDDSELTRVMIRDLLVSSGYEVVGEAEDGEQAYGEYKRLQPDLVTMDITMPNVNGIQALKMIRDYDPNAIVVMCSSMGEQFKVIEAIKAGAKEFIVKPFTTKEALKAISKALGN